MGTLLLAGEIDDMFASGDEDSFDHVVAEEPDEHGLGFGFDGALLFAGEDAEGLLELSGKRVYIRKSRDEEVESFEEDISNNFRGVVIHDLNSLILILPLKKWSNI